MKSKISKIISVVFILFVIFIFGACSKVKVEKIELSAKKNATIGDEVSISYEISPEGASDKGLVWESSDDTLATVQNGKVTCLAEGEVIITAKINDVSASITIIIEKPITIEIEGENNGLEGARVQLNAKSNSKYAATWKSSNEEVATVDGYGLVSCLQEGETDISATVEGISASIHFTVIKKVYTITVTGDNTVQSGKKMALSATVNYDDEVIIWTTSDSSLATVDGKGVVSALHKGVVTITATIKDAKCDFQLTITPSIKIVGDDTCSVGGSITLSAETDSDDAVTWTSSDETKATVSNGVVSFTAEGEVKITATVEGVTAEKYISGIYPVAFIGETGYETIEDALMMAEDGDTIRVIAGTYNENLLIAKPVTLVGPNEGKNPNTDTRVEEAIFKGTISVDGDTENVTISGFKFTEGAQIEVRSDSGEIKNFKFLYNLVVDTDDASISWANTRNYDLQAFINASLYGNKLSNFEARYNKFDNVSAINIHLGVVDGVIISDNTFTNFDYDCIRAEGGYNYGDWVFDNNVFKNDTLSAYNAIYCMATGASEGDNQTITVTNNKFENIGTADVYCSGALTSNVYQEYGLTWTVKDNEFKNCTNYIFLRNNATAAHFASYPWVCEVENNKFYGAPLVYYVKNNSSSDTLETNPNMIKFENNLFYDLDGNTITPDNAKIIGVKAE